MKKSENPYQKDGMIRYEEAAFGIYYRKEIELDVSLARTILKEAKAREIISEGLPENDDEAIQKANDLVEMAQTAWQQMVRGPEVEAILTLYNNANGKSELPVVETEASVEVEDWRPGEEEKSPPGFIHNEPWPGYRDDVAADIKETVISERDNLNRDEFKVLLDHVKAFEVHNQARSGVLKFVQKQYESIDELPEALDSKNIPGGEEEHDLTQEYEKVIDQATEELKEERLQVPSPPSEEIPQLPNDWTKISDTELQTLHGKYNQMAYYKSYLVSLEERKAFKFKTIADELYRELLAAADKYDDHNKQKLAKVLEAEIETTSDMKTCVSLLPSCSST